MSKTYNITEEQLRRFIGLLKQQYHHKAGAETLSIPAIVRDEWLNEILALEMILNENPPESN